MCYVMQSICERYLKHIIDVYFNSDAGSVMRTYTIRNLRDFIQEYIPDFECDWDTALKADGYYLAQYPGDDAILVDRDDVNACWAATNAVRNAVCRYIHKGHASKDVLREISAFD